MVFIKCNDSFRVLFHSNHAISQSLHNGEFAANKTENSRPKGESEMRTCLRTVVQLYTVQVRDCSNCLWRCSGVFKTSLLALRLQVLQLQIYSNVKTFESNTVLTFNLVSAYKWIQNHHIDINRYAFCWNVIKPRVNFQKFCARKMPSVCGYCSTNLVTGVGTYLLNYVRRFYFSFPVIALLRGCCLWPNLQSTF
jgi:hypothetical protein